MLDYEISIKNPNGTKIAVLPDNLLDCDLFWRANSESVLTLTLSCCDSYGLETFTQDTRIVICATTCDCTPSKTFLLGGSPWFVERAELCDSGDCLINITATNAVGLLNRRIVAYDQANAKGMATNEPADNLLKRLFRQNGGVAAQTGNYSVAVDATRFWGNCITACADVGLAPQYTGSFGGQNLLQVMKTIAEFSESQGTRLYFDIRTPAGNCDSDELDFCTYIGQLGTDRTTLTLSPDNESIGNYCIAQDWRGASNRVYASGTPAGTYAIASDPNLVANLANNCFILRESTVAASNSTAANAAQDAADAELSRLSEVLGFDGVAGDTDGFTFGCDYDFGDRVTVYSDGFTFQSNVDSLHFNQNGGKQIIEPGLTAKSTRSGSGVAYLAKQIKQLQRDLDRLRAQNI